jgi:hypothetical protein
MELPGFAGLAVFDQQKCHFRRTVPTSLNPSPPPSDRDVQPERGKESVKDAGVVALVLGDGVVGEPLLGRLS